MQSNGDGSLLEIIDLASSLRQEQLFIASEQKAFAQLNQELSRNSTNVSQLAWICSQQRQNLNNLIVSRPESGPSSCCQRANDLGNTKFVAVYKAKNIKYQHLLAYSDLLNYLHRSPYLLAQCLAVGDRIDRITMEQMNSVGETILSGLYGNAIHSKDVEMVLKLMQELIEIQIVVNDNPRRMLRAGSCAFSRLYHRLHESLYSAKIFLTAALHEPIMRVLVEDEFMLDIDPLKAVMSFSLKERIRRFGAEDSPAYAENVNKYHQDTIDTLFRFTNRFIKSLAMSWTLFPATLRWLVQTMCHLLRRSEASDKDVHAILTDMVFTHFICPAVVSPDLFGVCDAPISENARANLIQIGQILQMLALIKHQESDSKLSDLYAKFDRGSVAELLEQLLADEVDITIGMLKITSQKNNISRDSVLVSQSELNMFIEFLRTVLENGNITVSGEDRRKLTDVLDQLPEKNSETGSGNVPNGDAAQIVPAINGGSGSGSGSTKTKQSIMQLGKSTKNKLAKTMSLNLASLSSEEGLQAQQDRINSSSSSSRTSPDEDGLQVLMIPVKIGEEAGLQLLTEAEVLTMNKINKDIVEPILSEENVNELRRQNDDKQTFNNVRSMMRNGGYHQKHARFSLSHDDASIGNTSDNLEAVSEAPSNHSVASSLELEENDQNDNLSDMVSANVSGRGTPNISGRDTPSSQVTEGENRPSHIQMPPIGKSLNKAQSDIEDKFCKFEIKKLIEGDETISIISDTWSTDVLASDSETIEANERDRQFSTPLIPSAVILPGDNNFDALTGGVGGGCHLRGGHNLDETQSESAWSTDVLASDSEKMTEIDTDDNQSIAAKSDITDAGRSEGEPNGRETQRAPESPFFAPRIPSIAFRTAAEAVESTGFFNARPISTAKYYSGQHQIDGNGDGELGASAFPPNPFINGSYGEYRNSDEPELSEFDDDKSSNAFRRADDDKESHRLTSERLSVFKTSNDLLERFNDEQKTTGPRYEYPAYGDEEDDEDVVLKTNTNLINPFIEEVYAGESSVSDAIASVGILQDPSILLNGDLVEHRRLSSEQRNASFDGRRNGMMEFGVSPASSPQVTPSSTRPPSYENHEIGLQMRRLPRKEHPDTDDQKTQQQQQQRAQHQQQNGDEFLVAAAQKSAIASQNVNGRTQTNGYVNGDGTSTKTGKFTGAIPKSISFDASADKQTSCNLRRETGGRSGSVATTNGGTGFFSKIRQGFKNRRGHKVRSNHDDFVQAPHGIVDMPTSVAENGSGYGETTEDILAKYRRKTSLSSSDAANSDSTGSSSTGSLQTKNTVPVALQPIGDAHYFFDSAKRKLRAVLASTALHTTDFRHTNICATTPPLLIYLQIQLAQALTQQNLQSIAYVSETIRCLNTMDVVQHQKLVECMQKDMINRQSYLQYLMRYRQNLLAAIESVARFGERLQSDRETCNMHLINVCVRMFLEKREQMVMRLQSEFTALTVLDEKIDLLDEFINELMTELRRDGFLYGMAEWQLVEARNFIERVLLQRLYRQVMFPNDDGDLSRDEVLREHIRKLSMVISPSHSALRISQQYVLEAPWPFAQQQIAYISAYKTPNEKVKCVVQTIRSILNLLTMTSDRVPSADDLTPVLIYVIIKANPRYLLSTIQYVNCFIGDKLEGEVQYFWTQFCSAVQFIKTMDYGD